MQDAHRAIEAVARSSYGRLVAFLSSQTGDVAGAEDALSDALLAALSTWPREGVPAKPEAWLLTAARNRLVDQARHARVQEEHRAEHAGALGLLGTEAGEAPADEFPDRRLELLFVCAHPAIDAAVHTPLMLQTVLGLDAARIAQAFLLSPAAMGQRLVRAKTKIREAGIPFEVPEEKELPHRLEAVLEAIYAAYGLGWDEAAGADPAGRELADEALWLARVLRQRMPDEPEARGLLALLLFCDARRPARRAADGRYIPLSEQDPERWFWPAIREAESELGAAAKLGRIGRFQLEAAIQSVHIERSATGRTDWDAIALLYEHLVRLAPTLGARIGQAAAVAEAQGPAAGLALLAGIERTAVAAYQPYWAVNAHLLQCLERPEASEAFARALELTADAAILSEPPALARHRVGVRDRVTEPEPNPMCPACFSTLALIAVGTGSTGGLTALLAKKLRGKNDPKPEREVRAPAPSPQEKPR
jgi:RNA polymerase sigma-70 factor (ECF subfamily)